MANFWSNAELDAFLDEGLPPERMAQIETALREDPQLAEQLAVAVGRRDVGVHTLGGIWRCHRLTCPTREQWGSYLLGVLDLPTRDYFRFHVETIGCRLCLASLADLQAQQSTASAMEATTRRRRYFESSAGMLSSK